MYRRSQNTIDPRNSDDAQVVVEGLIPEIYRAETLQLVADSILLAHKYGKGIWEVTLARSGNFVRLNIGRIEILAIFCNFVHLVLDGDPLSDTSRSELEDYGLLTGNVYNSVPSSICYNISPLQLKQSRPIFWDAYHSVIAKAADTVQERTGYHIYHSTGMMTYLRRELGLKKLPEPQY